MTFQQKQAQSRAGKHQAALVHVETEGREAGRSGEQVPSSLQAGGIVCSKRTGRVAQVGPKVLARSMAFLAWLAGRQRVFIRRRISSRVKNELQGTRGGPSDLGPLRFLGECW